MVKQIIVNKLIYNHVLRILKEILVNSINIKYLMIVNNSCALISKH